MAENENRIGVRADFIMEDFKRHQEEYNARLARANKATENFYQEQNQAASKAATAAETNAKKTEEAHNKSTASFRKFAIAAAAVSATVVIAYKEMSEAAKELGDTETIAKFGEIDATLGALRDTVLQTGLEILKMSGFLDTVADGLMALNQLAILAGASLVGFISIVKDMAAAGKGYGIEDLGKPGVLEELNAIDFGAIQKRAQEAQRNALQNILTAPDRRKSVASAAEAEKDAEKARKEAHDNLEKYMDAIRDLQIKSGEDILAAEKDLHDKSAKAWQDYISKTNEIVANGIKERAKIQQTYQDAISAAERDYQRSVEDLSYSHGQKLADIERNYQDTIRNIQQTYQEDARDAIRNLDAIALIRAKEKRDKDLANANQDRSRQISAEQENYNRSLFELVRALADKKQEADEARRRDLDEQRRNEQEKQDEAKQSYNAQLNDAQAAFNERISAIRGQHKQEYDEAQAHYLGLENQLRTHLAAMQAITAAYGFGTGGGGTKGVGGGGGMRGRAEGGVDIVNRPTQFVAGEAGPEMAMFIPLNRALPTPITQTVNHTGDFSHSIDAAVRSSVSGMDGRIVAAVRKVLAEVLG